MFTATLLTNSDENKWFRVCAKFRWKWFKLDGRFVTDVKHYMHTLYPDSHGTLASVSTWKGIVMTISAAKNCMGKSKAEVKPSNFWNPLFLRNTHWIPTNWTVHCGFIPEMWKHWVTPGNMRGKLSQWEEMKNLYKKCVPQHNIFDCWQYSLTLPVS